MDLSGGKTKQKVDLRQGHRDGSKGIQTRSETLDAVTPAGEKDTRHEDASGRKTATAEVGVQKGKLNPQSHDPSEGDMIGFIPDTNSPPIVFNYIERRGRKKDHTHSHSRTPTYCYVMEPYRTTSFK